MNRAVDQALPFLRQNLRDGEATCTLPVPRHESLDWQGEATVDDQRLTYDHLGAG